MGNYKKILGGLFVAIGILSLVFAIVFFCLEVGGDLKSLFLLQKLLGGFLFLIIALAFLSLGGVLIAAGGETRDIVVEKKPDRENNEKIQKAVSVQNNAPITSKMPAPVKEGRIIKFGKYKQNGDSEEDILWRVLAEDGNKKLVISEYALDCKPYNDEKVDVTWETCTLRKWLNNDFFDSAFSFDEKVNIFIGNVPADKNPEYGTNPGNATKDKVFLLSIAEANEYFSSESDRQCEPTDYAAANGAYFNGEKGNCWWWLRSRGHLQSYAASVSSAGVVYEVGFGVSNDDIAVRPAMWINLDNQPPINIT